MLICNDCSHSTFPVAGADGCTAPADAVRDGVWELVAVTDPGELAVPQPTASSAAAAEETAVRVRHAHIASP